MKKVLISLPLSCVNQCCVHWTVGYSKQREWMICNSHVCSVHRNECVKKWAINRTDRQKYNDMFIVVSSYKINIYLIYLRVFLSKADVTYVRGDGGKRTEIYYNHLQWQWASEISLKHIFFPVLLYTLAVDSIPFSFDYSICIAYLSIAPPRS